MPSNLSTRSRDRASRLVDFERKKPVDRMRSSSSSRDADAMASASGKRAKRAGVTRLTRTSVHWALSTVATSNWKGLSIVELAARLGVHRRELAVDGARPTHQRGGGRLRRLAAATASRGRQSHGHTLGRTQGASPSRRYTVRRVPEAIGRPGDAHDDKSRRALGAVASPATRDAQGTGTNPLVACDSSRPGGTFSSRTSPSQERRARSILDAAWEALAADAPTSSELAAAIWTEAPEGIPGSIDRIDALVARLLSYEARVSENAETVTADVVKAMGEAHRASMAHKVNHA